YRSLIFRQRESIIHFDMARQERSLRSKQERRERNMQILKRGTATILVLGVLSGIGYGAYQGVRWIGQENQKYEQQLAQDRIDQRAAFDRANAVTLEVGGQFQTLPIRNLGEDRPRAYNDQYCGGKTLNCGLHNFVYDTGNATALFMNDSVNANFDNSSKIIYTRDASTPDIHDNGKPGPVQALIAVDGDRPTPELKARVLANGSIEVVDVAAEKTPDPYDGFEGSPIVVFVKDDPEAPRVTAEPTPSVSPSQADQFAARRFIFAHGDLL
ncbi:MAG TPA: hypothetical protein VLF20_04535, partial [Patescibacteria group bacterium]|nr:hypothetical protein [Patescibacteria group bacterium]